ncbi:MAG TPA: type II toxin-antitoxin system RelE/ParE family toxin, partial [Roseimicrobium sp.]|nr:type II toxin-antitoxin system RelE/ParE family toxin [Roseimicrobium sp.]
RSPGLGSQFIDEFDRQIAAIATAPDRWKLAKGDIRRCLMQRFPYIIYFRSLNNNRIRILLVRHQKRHPAFGSERR